MLEDIYSHAGNVAKTLAGLLCIKKESDAQDKLLLQIQTAILDGRISIDVSEIYHCVQACPGKSDIVLNQLLQLQDNMVRIAVEQAKSNRSLDDKARKQAKILHQTLGEPITAMERSLSSFMTWKSYDEKKVLRFFKKYKGQLADFRMALTKVGLDPVIDPEAWSEQTAMRYDP